MSEIPNTTVVKTSHSPLLSRRSRPFDISVIVTAVAVMAMVVAIIAVDMPRLFVGLLVIALMLGLMLLRVPIGIAFIAASLVGLWKLAGPRAVTGGLEDVAFNAVTSWSLSVIPMFILMGIALGKSGLTGDAYISARKWFGRLPGGLAVATNFAGAGLAAGSGSTIGISYAIGRVAIPEMIRAGYKPTVATGSVAMAGTLGQIIPPSILLVIYAGVAEVSVGRQLLAGVVPGVILAVAFALVIVVWALIDPRLAPHEPARVRWAEKFRSLRSLVPIAVIVAVVIGGMFFGFFTATEAGAFGATAAVAVGAVALLLRERRGKPLGKFLSGSILETASATASVFLLLIGVMLLTRVVALSGLAQAFGDFVIELGLNQITFLFVLLVLYLILGMFMDTLAAMLLTVPIFIGPLVALEVDLIWFGVFVVVLAEIGLVTPPLGILTFIVHGIAQSSLKEMKVKVGLTQVFKGVVPFVITAIVFLIVMIFFPAIVTWLPDLSFGDGA